MEIEKQLEWRGTEWLKARGFDTNAQPIRLPEVNLLPKDCRKCGEPVWLLRVDGGWMLFTRIWGYKRGVRVHVCSQTRKEPRANLEQTQANSITW